ncbi:MAG: NAD(P)/FAD-dependent oxidoreductase [Gemmatimonadota bacterium]|nr:NAD(P)/FAD-dependent oxidoreductase [Gemmatimonadota bacterium]MDH3422838.1 NAD(P)/FAD-dependent oxidoreductase [Gemmatimonadota bacterium]
MEPPHVVIVGAGFGGLWAARGLVNRPVRVTLVDRNNYHTFFPLLYQVAAAELVPTDIAHPVRSIFRRARNVDVRMAAMTGLDLDRRAVLTDTGPLDYDYLVLALGSEPNFFGVPGAAEYAFPLRWMADAVPLRHHVLTRFEAASTADPARRQRLLTFVVVGGGPTGVEYAGALSELIFGPLLEDFPGVDRDEVRIELVEASGALLGGMPEQLGRYAGERLTKRRVGVRLGTAVGVVEKDAVRLSGGEILPTETVVWTAGVRGEPRAAAWGLPVGPAGRVPVTPFLHLEERSEVFVIGDLAYLEDGEGRALPQVAQVAIQQGRRVAANVRANAGGRPMAPFTYRDPGMLAVIGRNAAVAHVFGFALKGWTAWFLWLGIHISWLIGFRNRALVLLNWGWNYVRYRRAVRLILPTVRASREDADYEQL